MDTKKEFKVILVAEDDEDDRLLVRDAFTDSGLPVELRWVADGEELMDYLFQRNGYDDFSQSPEPNLILLDLNMPKKDGREALAEIMGHPKFRDIPVIVLTTSRDAEDVQQCREMGVSSFVTKPNSFQSLVDVMKEISRNFLEPPFPSVDNLSTAPECGN